MKRYFIDYSDDNTVNLVDGRAVDNACHVIASENRWLLAGETADQHVQRHGALVERCRALNAGEEKPA
jgi:hypothetical protein